jgi:hypothetical protein
VDGVDYIRTARDVDALVDEATRQARVARTEARLARSHPGLDGPATNAEAEAARFERQVMELREVAIRMRAGYDWWDRFGLESSIDANGDPSSWQALAERLDRDLTYSHEGDFRMPEESVWEYGAAYDTGLFSRFEVCHWFETDGDCVAHTHSFLFGVSDFTLLGACLFRVSRWDC